jgi:hypothetical protein
MTDADRIKQLEETNKQLQRSVNLLLRRVALVEKKANVMSHTLRLTETNVRQLSSKLQINESKVSRVENILGRHS